MSIKQQIECAVCGTQELEKEPGTGFIGWGSLQGVNLDGEDNPTLCKLHLSAIADHLDYVKREVNK
jgi:hypothetical protein